MELTQFTIKQAHQGLVKKDFSALEFTEAFLDKLKQEDKKIHAFLTVTEDLAISQAKRIDNLIAQKKDIPILAGIPCVVKDNILIEGIKCTSASKILENYIASYDATCIKKLKEQGVVFLGKTNLDEFAMGSSCENSAFGPTRNPYDLTRVPGGSSGGSAAAVAANFSVFGLGSDTGGSIRQPCSFCGVVGLKPTYGAVSRYGLIAFASSLDQIGPITKTVEDARIVFDAIKGQDEMDSTSVEMPKIENYKLKIENLRIGVPKEYFTKGMDSEVEKAVKRAIEIYKKMGTKILEISLPHAEYALPCYYIIAPSEASANLARYDGIKYGKTTNDRQQVTGDLIDYYLKVRGEGFGPEVKRRIMLGTYALSAGYYEAYYKKAQKVRTLIQRDFKKAFDKVDIILAPTSPSLPFKLGEKIDDPLSMYLTDIYTVSINLAGIPAISIPCAESNNLPIGIQLIANAFEEDKIFEAALAFEKS
ncbi:MAG: Asp-tRNA(Asn)/Glu-tRNA(Gln) amidotransferase GatCAB subunit A [Candidatus Nealsonbacteria bacterium CG_4_9_14_3_um_filter_35_11]|uniref:Glutamyl-tRNA(Gln) amidotransferase subunit A n=2 Tax=Candidatus Nealsoniibacteriota TaxID=1817911 RepID=A0A2M7DBC2_9BACT|nr:MAG: Asp-tRNA(Asn)/Glu-tRNA(Gln) amidotransferase GatCAB subunit A [Candidatus Nealsonbacteria bacterium CG11_big_fil_rev_8_21_14_0_20_35_11]PIV45730.1 MAG: Asp-tRNA(Asn)/Glu-tRNA(Gln) amidotransferase GatCAB subunit A [Candidatus Nealsonbacteria bacterium CG02_land_8_20_14_3_00_34_20]PIW92638.1 MAG: Asp-tRNA(Asn)/Glu-tRNA(Gln) amidotransferase GatCAB subunit A [Candidatus Nealsonbacteria bacterium CG_4_8_14_3_um_filter_34_13]PIZ90096.1 MAG: Asp-tRNA(Asn)/Glu-tRNA(Gln) amidotransferase GatCAB